MAEFEKQFKAFSLPVRQLLGNMRDCTLCPRRCHVNRFYGETGYCGIGADPKVSSAGPHYGEESVLVGSGGSGTVFFAGCNLSCIFCQNYDISHYRRGEDISIDQLAGIMLDLQKRGCSNINFVTPSHVTAAIAAAIELAKKKGLSIPAVYNSGGYDSVETLRKLEGLIDIYMPDMKYGDSEPAGELSDVLDYTEICFDAVQEMHRQVGDLEVKNGLAVKGLMVRHLVLPNGIAKSEMIIDFLAEEVSDRTAINVMGQYRPCYKAFENELINRRPTTAEIESVRAYARDRGLKIL